MSHEPPVPPGNQSPYPIHEPQHAPSVTPVTVAKVVTTTVERSPAGNRNAARRRLPVGAIAGAAAGVGAIAFGIAALLFPRDGKAKPKGNRKRKR